MARATEWSRAAATATVVVALLAGCAQEHDTPGAATDRAALMDLVTGDAAAALDPDARFVLAASPLSARPEITGAQALGLAAIWARAFAPMIREPLTKEREESIDLRKLAPCGEPHYAASPFEPLPTEAPDAYHRLFGPWWIVGLCDGGAQLAVSLAVSAYATHLTIADGELRFPALGSGHEFISMGVPRSWEGGVASSAESAALRAARLTGRRIAKAPELVAPDPRSGRPQKAIWRITLDAPATVRSERSASPRDVSEVFVGVRRGRAPLRAEPAVLIAPEAAPAPIVVSARIPNDQGRGAPSTRPARTLRLEVRARPGYPLALENVQVDASGGN